MGKETVELNGPYTYVFQHAFGTGTEFLIQSDPLCNFKKIFDLFGLICLCADIVAKS